MVRDLSADKRLNPGRDTDLHREDVIFAAFGLWDTDHSGHHGLLSRITPRRVERWQMRWT